MRQSIIQIKFLFLALLLATMVLGPVAAEAQPFAYVTTVFSNSVAVIDADPTSATFNTVIATVAVESPRGVAMTPNGKRAYVAHFNSPGTVSVIDTDPTSPNFNTVVATIADGPIGGFFGIAIAPDGGRAYVTGVTVEVIDTDPTSPNFNTFAAQVAGVFQGGGKVTITPDGSRGYKSNRSLDTVSVIDTDPTSPTFNTEVDTVVGIFRPQGLAVTPDGTRAYVASTTKPFTTLTVAVIDTDPTSPTFNTEVDTVPVFNLSTVAITPDGTRAYVAGGGGTVLSTIDTDPTSATFNTLINMLIQSGRPAEDGIAITPDGRHAYVARAGPNSVAVIDTDPTSPTFNFQVGTVAGLPGFPVTVATTPPSPQQKIEVLIGTLEKLITQGALDPGQGGSLIRRLEVIATQLDQGNEEPAIQQLNTFNDTVAGLVTGGQISSQTGNGIISQTENIRLQLLSSL